MGGTTNGGTVASGAHGSGIQRIPAGVRRVLRPLLSLVVVGAIAWAARTLVDWSEVWAAIVDMSWLEIVTLVVAAAWNIATYLLVMMAAMPGLSYRDAFLVGQSSTAVSATLPAGSALGVGMTYGMYASLGHSGPDIALATVLTGIWNNFVKLGLPIVAFAALAIMGDATGTELTAALIGIGVLVAAVGVFALMLRSDDLAARVGWWMQRVASPVLRLLHRPPDPGWDRATVDFRRQTIGLLRRRWLSLSAATVISHLSLYFVLLLALRHMDVSEQMVTWAQVLAVFSLTRLVTALPVTPGGLGLVEVAMTAGLVVAGGPRPAVVAAVLIYRVLTLFVQIPIGAACYLYWRATAARRDPVHADVAPDAQPVASGEVS